MKTLTTSALGSIALFAFMCKGGQIPPFKVPDDIQIAIHDYAKNAHQWDPKSYRIAGLRLSLHDSTYIIARTDFSDPYVLGGDDTVLLHYDSHLMTVTYDEPIPVDMIEVGKLPPPSGEKLAILKKYLRDHLGYDSTNYRLTTSRMNHAYIWYDLETNQEKKMRDSLTSAGYSIFGGGLEIKYDFRKKVVVSAMGSQ